ncbi:hypothetical protein ABD76_06025 [Paenibacillus dendritiformis]|nr:hypothetical protein [Paenibacillus dendritiformis]MBG9792083.1 hypothetical protein [Paenibacillus dendritiformis]
MTSTEKQTFRDRANRAARELEKEKSAFGYINDGAGRRYRIGVNFLLSGDLQRSAEAFDWFYEEFPDDVGEPVFNLYSALAAYRCGEMDKARTRLLGTMLSNIFLLPHLIGRKFEAPDAWHPSNRHQESYLGEIEGFLSEPSSEELRWIEAELSTPSFEALRSGYIATFSALNGEQDIGKRVGILKQWEILQAAHFPDEGVN